MDFVTTDVQIRFHSALECDLIIKKIKHPNITHAKRGVPDLGDIAYGGLLRGRGSKNKFLIMVSVFAHSLICIN